jgi:hypothetical protein
MPKWNVVAMGEVGLTGWKRQAARPVARLIARRTGRPESQILAFIGAGFLLITLIDFLRTIDHVVTAGRTSAKGSALPIHGGPSGDGSSQAGSVSDS